ncbi:MAG: ABC transporter permease [Rhodothermales bacterium]
MLLSNYAKIVARSLRKHLGNSFLNLFGLATSMAACLLIMLFVHHERSFDSFHDNAEQIYRLNEVQSFPGITPQHVALSMYPMGPTLKDDFPEVIEFTRVAGGPQIITIDGKQRRIESPLRVDPAFFSLFNFPVLYGDPLTAMEEPYSVVLTEEYAQSLYGTTEALDKEFTAGDQVYRVVAVLAPLPAPSHLRFDALFTLKDFDEQENMQNWGSNWLVTYLQLANGANIASIEAKFPAYKSKYMDEVRSGYYDLYLQSLSDVHLGSAHITHDYRNWQKFNRSYIYIFILLAIFVLVIAGINFMNLTTARSATRAKEVGVRKAVGAQRFQLTMQFLGESVAMAFIALILAIAMAWIALPFMRDLSLRDLSMITLLKSPVLLGTIGATLVVGLLAGLYPAALLSAYQPVHVLKGLISKSGRKSPFRNVLVVSQFTIAIALIVGTLLASQQLHFMQNRDIGFNKEYVMVVPMSRIANEKYELLKNTLQEDPAILSVTASNQRLGNNLHQWGTRVESESGELTDLSISNLVVDYNYLAFYDIQIKEGRWFSEDRGTDFGSARVVNEAMVAEMGWTDPLGKQIGFGGDDTLGTVIGVASDFNFNSLHHNVEPLAMSVQDFGYSETSVRIDPESTEAGIAAVENIWRQIVTDRPFEYTFLDDHMDELYRADQQVSTVISAITGLAILIACLGLFGLAAITTEQRTKELGVRKALGSSVLQIFVLLSYEFTRLVMFAFLIATPITYFVMQAWLEGYPYHVDIGVGVFLFSGILTLFVALATVSYRAIKAARMNPIEALRYE